MFPYDERKDLALLAAQFVIMKDIVDMLILSETLVCPVQRLI